VIIIVTGPPCSGKSTYCRQHAGPDDVVIDLDVLATALSGPRPGQHTHTHSPASLAVARAARTAAIERAMTVTAGDCYIIHTKPSPQARASYTAQGAQIIDLDPGIDVALARAKAERPWQSAQAVKAWYQPTPRSTSKRHDPPATRKQKTRQQRGLGAKHDAERKRLLANHRDGTACWWCLLGMYRDPLRNPDRAPLEADHSIARSKGGTVADRLLHSRCNRSRGDGSRDAQRPANANAPGQGSVTTRDWLG
jgi:hypothetical protein